ncbi:HAD hydrolase family protein [Amycolatopsis orientalis]|uniref:HAD hydrolase family protein n=1 Tax=Amycolatopsis orientalis TaxID=31958 RepID=UPI000399C9EE|nr:HAD hydrolase family protein [Amycolatopsis orientalis]
MGYSHRDKLIPDGGRLVVADLLCDLSEITHLLAGRTAAEDPLDTFLLAAAAVQVVEDRLQRDVFALRRAARYLGEHAAVRPVPEILGAAGTAVDTVTAWHPAARRAFRWRTAAAALRDTAALDVLRPGSSDAPAARLAAATRLRGSLLSLDRDLIATVLRIPSCFRSFDQEPADLVALAARYALRYPERERPVLVLGVRTSGSYLAPLAGAALRAEGYRDVHADTVRPGYRMRPSLRALLRRVAGRGGRIAVIDDPPETGQSIAEVAEAVRQAGVPAEAITLLLPLFADTPPAILAGYDTIALPYRDWAVHARLETEAAMRSLSALVGRPVRAAGRLSGAGLFRGREHARAVFDVEFPDGETRRVAASGAGLGFFGRHALAVADALPGRLPRTYGVRDGLVFRDWLPDDQRITVAEPADARDLAGYVRARAASMPAASDRARNLAGRQPAWEAASRVLQRNYGRAGVALRPVLLDRAVRRLCTAPVPSVVDGATGLAHWFRGPAGLSKADADVRDFANTDLACYDPVYDLAGIDPGSPDAEFVAALRREMPSDPERFLLYELVHLWDRARDGQAVSRAGARAVQRYLAEVLLPAAAPAPDGDLVALDLDGVLESDALGFAMATPTAVVALRALHVHGFRPVLVTGRSTDEVAERCRTYGLAGGVAEYGSVVFLDGTAHDLVPAAEKQALNAVRAALAADEDVVLDPDFEHVVRARRASGGALRREQASRALDGPPETAPHVRVVAGDEQTDFVAAGVDKGTALRLLAEKLGAPVALAVGDTATDLPMLRLAALACAPGNADKAVRASEIQVLRRDYALAVSQAVERLLGHRPGSCDACRPPARSRRTRTLLTVLDASNGGARGLPTAIARFLLTAGLRR